MTVNNGDWSVAELIDLVAAYDYNFTQLGGHFDAYKEAWVTADPTAFSDWSADWYDLQQRYAAARSNAQTVIDASAIAWATPDSMIDAQGMYVAVLTAVKQVPGTVTKGDFDDLDKRLLIASGQATDYSDEPQPKPGSDLQFAEYQASDAAVGAVQFIAQAAGAAVPVVIPTWVWPAAAVTVGLIIVAKVKEIL